ADGALARAPLDHVGGGRVEDEAALRVEKHVTRGFPIEPEASLLGKTGTARGVDHVARGPDGPHPGSMYAAYAQSRRWQRISVFLMRAATQRSCISKVVAWRTTKSMASSESRRARGTRDRKYASISGLTHGECCSQASTRFCIRSGAKNSVSEEATASTRLRSPTRS